jgi:cell wall-associated NlpC family hydrolase
MYTNAAGQAKWCYANGKAVGRSELQPGDLIFWQNLSCSGCGRWNEVHLVGIYVGDGNAIEARSSRGCVVVRDLWSSSGYPISIKVVFIPLQPAVQGLDIRWAASLCSF